MTLRVVVEDGVRCVFLVHSIAAVECVGCQRHGASHIRLTLLTLSRRADCSPADIHPRLLLLQQCVWMFHPPIYTSHQVTRESASCAIGALKLSKS